MGVTCGPELQMLQMQSSLLILVFPSLLQALDTVLRAEIASAAAESRNLASELAAMLLRLEGGDQGISDDGEDIIDEEEEIVDDGEDKKDIEDSIDNSVDLSDVGEDMTDAEGVKHK